MVVHAVTGYTNAGIWHACFARVPSGMNPTATVTSTVRDQAEVVAEVSSSHQGICRRRHTSQQQTATCGAAGTCNLS